MLRTRLSLLSSPTVSSLSLIILAKMERIEVPSRTILSRAPFALFLTEVKSIVWEVTGSMLLVMKGTLVKAMVGGNP